MRSRYAVLLVLGTMGLASFLLWQAVGAMPNGWLMGPSSMGGGMMGPGMNNNGHCSNGMMNGSGMGGMMGHHNNNGNYNMSQEECQKMMANHQMPMTEQECQQMMQQYCQH